MTTPTPTPVAWLIYCRKGGESIQYATVDENDSQHWPVDQWKSIKKEPLFLASDLSAAQEARQAAEERAERMEGLLLLSLYHHQGGSSPVGQPIRRLLGIGPHDHMTDEQIERGKAAGRAAIDAAIAEGKKNG